MIARFTARASAVAAAAVAVAVLASGCGQNTDPGEAAPEWDPCTAFPESAMQSVGMERKANGGVPGAVCVWSGNDYVVSIRYLERDVDWSLGYQDITPTTVGSYRGNIYHLEGESHPYKCGLQLETRGANVLFEVENTMYREQDPCAVATRIATGLESYLPPAA
ncbi:MULTISPECIES: DUF3558 family protein [unclassified Nocardia]|uniref:DUF3558 family protein n=1 Tax=unclassified Nocardia TaxID=2637762 RepID=UPI00278C14A7|nr:MULTISPECIES: DUF3558 family protein [unclassified Nocardia]